MQKLFTSLLVILYAALLLFPFDVFAAPVLTVAPNPVLDNKKAYLIATGCPPGQQASFTWKKNEPDTGTATVNDKGVAAYEHTFSEGTYTDVKVTCGNQTASLVGGFSSIAVPDTVYIIQIQGDSSYRCQSIPKGNAGSNMMYASQTSCQQDLNARLALASPMYYPELVNGTFVDKCKSIDIRTGYTYSRDSALNYYDSSQACIEGETTNRSKWEVFEQTDTHTLQCRQVNDPVGTSFNTQAECDASKVNWKYALAADACGAFDTTKFGEQYKDREWFDTYQACAAVAINYPWYYIIPDEPSDENGIKSCEQNPTETVYDPEFATKAECTKAFCEALNAKGDGPFAEAFKASCSEEGLLPPTDPPPCADLIVDQGCAGLITPLGRISTNAEELVQSIFRILLSISGGIALLVIIRSGYQMMTSQGNPEKVKEAREMLTSAIVGLLFLVFSFVILEIIGVDILRIPGFGR